MTLYRVVLEQAYESYICLRSPLAGLLILISLCVVFMQTGCTSKEADLKEAASIIREAALKSNPELRGRLTIRGSIFAIDGGGDCAACTSCLCACDENDNWSKCRQGTGKLPEGRTPTPSPIRMTSASAGSVKRTDLPEVVCRWLAENKSTRGFKPSTNGGPGLARLIGLPS